MFQITTSIGQTFIFTENYTNPVFPCSLILRNNDRDIMVIDFTSDKMYNNYEYIDQDGKCFKGVLIDGVQDFYIK